MKSYHYPVYIKKSQTEKLEEAIFPIFPNSKKPMHLDLTDSLFQCIIMEASLEEFLRQMLLSELEDLDEHNKEIIEPKPLEYYKPTDYSLYLMTGHESLRFDKLPEHAIALVGEEKERRAHIKESKNNIKTVQITLSANHQYDLQPPARDTYQPIKKVLSNCAAVTRVKEQILSLAHIRYFSCHDELKTIDVTFRSRNRSQCCARYLPPITKMTFVIEITAGTILMINALQQSEGSILPIDPKTGKIITTIQSIFSSLIILPLVLTGPGAQYMGEFGEIIDSFFSKVFYRRTRAEQEEKVAINLEQKPYEQKNSYDFNIKKNLVKALLIIGVLNHLWTDANFDYIQFKGLLEIINNPDSLFPKWLVTACAWTTFFANQVNDPVFMFSFATMLIEWVDKYFSKPLLDSSSSLAEIGRGSTQEQNEISLLGQRPEELVLEPPQVGQARSERVVSPSGPSPVLVQSNAAESGRALFSFFTYTRQRMQNGMAGIRRRLERK